MSAGRPKKTVITCSPFKPEGFKQSREVLFRCALSGYVFQYALFFVILYERPCFIFKNLKPVFYHCLAVILSPVKLRATFVAFPLSLGFVEVKIVNRVAFRALPPFKVPQVIAKQLFSVLFTQTPQLEKSISFFSTTEPLSIETTNLFKGLHSVVFLINVNCPVLHEKLYCFWSMEQSVFGPEVFKQLV